VEIVFLNTWSGQIRDKFCDFVKNQISTTDIFCFQELDDGEGNIRQIIKTMLPQYEETFAVKKQSEKFNYSQGTFINPKLGVIDRKVIFPDKLGVGLGVLATVQIGNEYLTVCNFHGTPSPGTKQDTEERLFQSRGIIEECKNITNPVIIGGDFNLDINTESVRLFEEAGYRNLIKEFQIPTTRNEVSWRQYPGEMKQLYADFVFTKDVQVKSFVVPKDEVSDHQAMILNVES
jgi:endonuclease/exonuclease/phosphatase family metal-dependent hydrolase